VSFAELKNAGDEAKRFGSSMEVVIENINGLSQAQADLALNGSKLRAQLAGEGMDPKVIDSITRETEAWRAQNKIREQAIAVEEKWAPTVGRRVAKEIAFQHVLRPLGQDRGLVDRPEQKPLSAEAEAKIKLVEKQSLAIGAIWREISEKIDNISFAALAAGQPMVLGFLRVVNEGIDSLVAGFKWLNEHAGDWIGLMQRVLENTPGTFLIMRTLRYLSERGSEPVYGPQLPANDNKAGPARVPEAATPNVRGGRNTGVRAPPPGGEDVKPMSYEGTNDNNPLLHRTGYGGSGSGGGEGRAKDLIKGGVYEALVDFYSYVQTSGRGGGGIVPAAYNPNGGAGAGAGTGAGGAGTGPFKSGAGFSVIRQGSYGGGTPNGSSVGPGTGPGAHGNANPPAQTGSEAVTTAQGGSDLDRGAYDKMFKGTPLEGKYDKVVETAKANNVPPSLMAAIMAHETGRGTSKMLRDKNNPAGMMNGNVGRSYGSVDEGIDAAGRTIARNYQSGGGTIEGMQKSYAPIGAANDPGGLNSGWVGGVRRFQSQLGTKDGGGGAQTASIDPNQVLGTGNVDGTGAITGASTTGGKNPNGTDLPGRVQAVGDADPAAFITHHTSGRGTIAGVEATLQERGLGVQYVMDREGNIKQTGGPGASHIKTGWGEKGAGLSNRNVVGMEIIAKNDKDVTPAQAQAAAQFIQTKYPNIPVYGHGELNPGHREADEGQTAKAAVMALRNGGASGVPGDPRFPANAGPPKVGPEGVPIPPQAETANAAVPAGLDSGRMRQAFLNTILKGEAPKGSYGLVNGGGQITDFSKAPTGTAASGQYQFLPSTWAEQAKKYGYTDFKPETQDTAAWNYAKDIYKQKAGRDLGADLMSKDPQVLNGIGTALNKTWTSLPGGPEPNSNWKGQDFASAYSSNLGDGDIGGGGATPDAGTATASATPDASGASSSSGFNMKDFGSNLGSGLGDIGSIMAKGPVAQNAATKSGPANLPMTTLPPPVGPVPMVDPRVADAQRQQLAVALQRLNSRRLV
jgi:muramidase (phage lysozyme)